MIKQKITVLWVAFLLIFEPTVFALDGALEQTLTAPTPAMISRFPSRIVTVEERHLDTKNGPLIYLIEDPLIHSSREANIAKLLRVLSKKEHVKTVFVEGGNGEASLSFLKAKATRLQRVRTGRHYMASGQLSGPEYASMVSEHDLSLWGVEDQKSYEQTITALGTLEAHLPAMRRTVQKLENTIAELKKLVYSDELYHFDELYRGYETGEVSAAVYLNHLADVSQNYDITYEKYPDILSIVELKRMERRIHWKQADVERELAWQSLGVAEKTELAPFLRLNRAPEKINFSDKDNPWLFFYLLSKKITDWREYPELQKYITYLEGYLRLDYVKAIEEAAAFRPSLAVSMMRTDDERDLWRASEYVRVFKQFMNLRLSTEEAELWRKDLDKMDFAPVTDFLKAKIRALRITHIQVPVVPKTAVREITSTVSKIYALSRNRERVFVRNAIKKMTETGETKAAFVFSGFHSKALVSELRQRKISYLLLRPSPDKNFEQDEVRVVRERPIRSQLAFDLAQGSQPVLLAMNRDLGLHGKKNLEVMLSLIGESSKGLEQANPSTFANQEDTTVADALANVPEDWLFSEAVDEGFEKTDDKLSYARAITLLKDIERKRDIERYTAFKSFAATKREEMGKVIPVQDVLRKYEKNILFAVARAKLNTLYLSEQIKKSLAEGNITDQLPILASIGLGPAEAQVVDFIVDTVKPGSSGGGPDKPETFKPDPAEHELIHKFLINNITVTGMPLSFKVPKHFWDIYLTDMDEIDSALERILLQHSLSIYDAAVWQIALMEMGEPRGISLAERHNGRLIEGKSGELRDIRAYQTPFTYGDKHLTMEKDNAYFFRIIADQYIQEDPKFGDKEVKNFPNFDRLHHEDWKPITGEQAWAAIIGPLQMAYVKYNGKIPLDCREMKLAKDILVSVEAMRSPIGAIYHSPSGTHGKDPHDISNENNFSMHAALVMLFEVTKDRDPHTAARVSYLIEGIEDYFKKYAFDHKTGVFYQGGFYENNKFIPTKIYAVDCQTWGTAVLGQAFIDKAYGEGAAMRIWRNVKKRSGFYDRNKVLRGVGYTDAQRVLSTEWTCGAILNARLLADAYDKTHPYWSRELRKDAMTMRVGIEALKVKLEDGSIAYLYADKRSFIPFGWWANPVPSMMSSAWVILTDRGYNPFVLGGAMRQPGPSSIQTTTTKSTLSDLAFTDTGKDGSWKRLAGVDGETPGTLYPQSFTRILEMTAQVMDDIQLTISPNRLGQHGVEETSAPQDAKDYRWIWVLLLLATLVGFGVYYRRSSSKKT